MHRTRIYETKSYGSVNEIVLKHISSGLRVLDVGCGSGLLGEKVKAKGNYVTGIDISRVAIEIAKEKIDEAILLDIEEELPSLPPRSFDVITFSDILEHLYNPLKVLSEYKMLLKENGYIIISVPNVANWKIRKDLFLKGKFEYQSTGILDETHIRFFYT